MELRTSPSIFSSGKTLPAKLLCHLLCLCQGTRESNSPTMVCQKIINHNNLKIFPWVNPKTAAKKMAKEALLSWLSKTRRPRSFPKLLVSTKLKMKERATAYICFAQPRSCKTRHHKKHLAMSNPGSDSPQKVL